MAFKLRSGNKTPFKQMGGDKQTKQEVNKAKIKAWNEARLKTGRFSDQLGDGKMEKQFKNLDDLRKISRTEMVKLSDNKSLDSSFSGAKGMYLGGTDEKGKPLHHYFAEPTITHKTISKIKEIIGKDPDSTDLHEQVHGSTRGTYDSGQIKAIKNISLGTGEYYGSKYDDGTGESPYGYDGNPEEIFAQLMQLRINNNIDPNKVFGKKDLPKLKKMVDKQGASGMFGLDVYEDKELLRLMNEVADSGTEDDGTRFA